MISLTFGGYLNLFLIAKKLQTQDNVSPLTKCFLYQELAASGLYEKQTINMELKSGRVMMQGLFTALFWIDNSVNAVVIRFVNLAQ